MAHRTTIVIAHRLSTVEKCDRIVMVKSGRVIEDGKLKDLKENPKSKFNAYANLQVERIKA